MSKNLKNKVSLMKSRPMAARLRLSRIFRWLGVVVAIKLFILLALLFDLPLTLLGQSSLVATSGFSQSETVDSDNSALATVRQAQAAGLVGGDSTNSTAAPENKCPDTMDPLLRETLERKQSELDAREQHLNELEQNLNSRLADMQTLEARIQTMLKEAQGVRDEKLAHLVDVYVNMKPKQAAQVLETLDERTAVKILAGMKGRQAGEILTSVNPQKAARLSEMLTKMQLPFE